MDDQSQVKIVSLGNLIERTNRTKGDDKIPVYSVTKHKGFVTGYFNKKVHSHDQQKYRVVENGEFAYATIHLDEGSIGIAPELCAVSPMYTTFRISSDSLDPTYLLYYLKSERALAQYAILGTGSIERRKNIGFNAFSKINIPLPPLEEQKRIAKILDQVSKSIEEVNSQLSKFDELIQAQFHQQFPEEFMITEPLGEVASLIGGKSIVAKDTEIDSQFKVLKVSAITSGKFQANQVKNLPADYQPPKAHLIRPNDLLISRASGSSELVGATILVPNDIPENLALPDKIWKFDWKDRQSSPHFYEALLSTPEFKQRVLHSTSGSGASFMKNISKAKLLQIPVPKVSFQDQAEFAAFAMKVKALKSKSTQKLHLLTELQKSLQTRAFQGLL